MFFIKKIKSTRNCLTKSEEGELTDKEQERIPEIYKSEVTKASNTVTFIKTKSRRQ
jgi:hypothetical protein